MVPSTTIILSAAATNIDFLNFLKFRVKKSTRWELGSFIMKKTSPCFHNSVVVAWNSVNSVLVPSSKIRKRCCLRLAWLYPRGGCLAMPWAVKLAKNGFWMFGETNVIDTSQACPHPYTSLQFFLSMRSKRCSEKPWFSTKEDDVTCLTAVF